MARTIRQSPDTNGGAHNNNEELDVCTEALGSHFCRGWVFVQRGQASSSLMSKDPSTCARATMRAAGGCRGRHGGAARCGIQSFQCHVGLSLPRSQRQFGRRPHRTHGHAAVALPWVVLRGAYFTARHDKHLEERCWYRDAQFSNGSAGMSILLANHAREESPQHPSISAGARGSGTAATRARPRHCNITVPPEAKSSSRKNIP